MRTEIARQEIRYQEKLNIKLNATQTKPDIPSTKEVKFIMSQHRDEIEALKTQISVLKQTISDRDQTIETIKNKPMDDLMALNKDFNQKLSQIEAREVDFKAEIRSITQSYESQVCSKLTYF